MATILIVDDERDIVALLRIVLKKAGYKTREAGNGKEALKRLGVDPPRRKAPIPNIIILDMIMPDMDGVECLHLLRAAERTAKIPVIVLTSKTGDGWKEMSLNLGADAFLAKPVLPKDLLACIRKLLNEPGTPEVTPS